MATFEKVLWALDNEIQPLEFERLCVDVLGREGYRHIKPSGGTKDMGKDAEVSIWSGISDERSEIVFQFSLEKNWEKKLTRDAQKIASNFKNVLELVFVSCQRVTGSKKEKLKSEFRKAYNWELTIYDREWLRNRLCEYHQDLAKKYLDVDLPPTVGSEVTQLELCGFDEESAEEVFAHTSPETLRAIIVERTRKEPQVIRHWYNLARIDYLRRDYDSALEAINKALKTSTQDKVLSLNLNLNRGVILAEKGIASRSRPLLIQAKEILGSAAAKIKRPGDLYNLANVLSALGEIDEAGQLYAQCLELTPDNPQFWKNYGSVFVEKRQPEKGIECFDKALQLDPNLVEAYLSKATALVQFLNRANEAILNFETAYRIMPDLDRRWNYGRYWYSRALQVEGRLGEALEQIEIGLASQPGDRYLLDQKASVLRALRKHDSSFEAKSLQFFTFRAQAIHADFGGLVEIIDIFAKRGTPESAWQIVDLNLPCFPLRLSEIASRSAISIQEFKTGFQNATLYAGLRRHRSMDDHYVTLRNAGLSPDKNVMSALDFALMAPFGKMANTVRSALEKNKPPPMQTLFTDTLIMISALCASMGGHLLAARKPDERTDQVDLVSRGLLSLPDITVAEAGRMQGFIAGKFKVPFDSLENGQHVEWKNIWSEAAIKLMEHILKDWGLKSKRS